MQSDFITLILYDYEHLPKGWTDPDLWRCLWCLESRCFCFFFKRIQETWVVSLCSSNDSWRLFASWQKVWKLPQPPMPLYWKKVTIVCFVFVVRLKREVLMDGRTWRVYRRTSSTCFLPFMFSPSKTTGNLLDVKEKWFPRPYCKVVSSLCGGVFNVGMLTGL